MDDVLNEYPFLRRKNSVEDYVPPDYYDQLLRPYVFRGKTDLELFQDFVISNTLDAKNVLELCFGSGRVSECALSLLPNACFTLVDLSKDMLKHTSSKFESRKDIGYILDDAVNAMNNVKGNFDFVYTLWGFSHSIHQHMHRDGIKETKGRVERGIENTLAHMSQRGKIYIVHFDSMSEEQKILMHQWSRVYNIFHNTNVQSPSKRILDEILQKLDNDNSIVLTQKHLIGEPIYYKDKNMLLEIFLNFHLETYFNQLDILPDVVQDILQRAEKYKQRDGSYLIGTGCYIYEIEKRGKRKE